MATIAARAEVVREQLLALGMREVDVQVAPGNGIGVRAGMVLDKRYYGFGVPVGDEEWFFDQVISCARSRFYRR